MKTQEKGQFIIILYRAYLLNFLLDSLKLFMKIILLFKTYLMVKSTCQCLKSFRNDSLQTMAILNSLVTTTTTTYHIILQSPAFMGFFYQYYKSKLQVDRDPQIAVTGNEIDFFSCMSNTTLEKSISTCS